MYILKNYLIKDVIFPPRCPICETIVPKLGTVCNICKGKLPYIKEPRCKRCSKPIGNEETENCYDCMRKVFHYTSGRAVWIYNKSMSQSIGRFKYQNKQEYATFYGEEISRLYGKWMKDKKIEALIPVPIHKRKKNLRGYNQAELIANVISDNMEIPVFRKGLERFKETKPQKDLTLSERMRNMEAAFTSDKSQVMGFKRVALVDDIYTTGSTIEACTKELLKLGVDEVYFLCVCIGASV